MLVRRSKYPIASFIKDRWSPRAMSGQLISDQELMTLFEAARWAPSCYNNQPWRFIYAKRDTPSWDLFFNLLVPFNQSWCQRGAVLIVVLSANNFAFNNKPSRTHSFDAGAAFQNLSLQGSILNLVVHGMEGFDYEKARTVLAVPEDYSVEAMVVVGRPGKKEDLPADLQAREEPSLRNPLEQMVFEGLFNISHQEKENV